jgi:hypothetical protein
MNEEIRREFPDLPPLLPSLEESVREAYECVPFFRDFYGKPPQIGSLEDFARLPVTDRCLLGQAESLASLLADPGEIYGAIYALEQNHRTFPFQVVESKEEISWRHERIAFCIRRATGVDIQDSEAGKAERFLVLHNQAQAFFSSDLSSELAWERHQNALALVDASHTGREIRRKIEIFRPDFVFLAARVPHFQPEWIPPCVRGVFTFRQSHPALFGARGFECYDVYTLDEMPYVGVRLPGEDFYRYSPWHLYAERTGRGRLTFTALTWDNFAWIRYATYDHAEAADEFRFRIRYFGHW